MGILSLLRRLRPRGELRQGVLTLVGAAAIGQAIVVVSAPAITRLYSPSDVGAYSVASSILSVLIVVTCLRYEWAIPLPESDVAAANVVALCLLVAIGTSLIAGLALWIAGGSLLALLGASALGQWVVLIAVGQLGAGVVLALTGWAIRTKSFAEIGVNRLTQSGTLVAVQVVLGVLRLGPVGMLLGSVAGNMAGSGRLASTAWRTHAPAFRSVTWAGIKFAAGRYRRFPIFSSGSALLNSLGEQAPLLLLAGIFGATVGGQYALAVRVSALPVTLVAAAVSQVFVAETARLARDHPSALRGMFGRTTRTLALVAIGPFVLIALLAPILAGLVFGDAWRDTGFFVAVLAPMFYLQLVTSPTGGTLDVLERQDLHLVREILRLIFVGGAALVSAATHSAPMVAVGIFSVAGCLTYIAYGLASWRAITSHGSG
ncbi:MAG TPA: lipopolysaccharide biosynthesis protein [Candidatus Limnocylindrales bacterium]